MRWSRIVLVVVAIAAMASLARADDGELARQSLRGIRGFHVFVVIASGLQEAGLDSNLVRTSVELKLRQAGIRVLDWEETLRERQHGILTATANAVAKPRTDAEVTLYAVQVEVSVGQPVSLLRDPSIKTVTDTWSTVFVGVYGVNRISSLLGEFANLMDVFLNAYLAANPKPAGAR